MHRRARHLNPGSAGAVLALDSRFITGLSDGDPVSTWDNRNVSGVDATASGSQRPTFKTAQIGGQSVLRFNGSTNLMDIVNGFDSISGTENWSLIFVIKPENISTAPVFMTAIGLGPVDFFTEYSSSGGMFWGAGSGSYRTYTGSLANSNVTVLTFQKTSTTSGDFRTNGILNTSFSGSLSSTNVSTSSLRIMAYGSGFHTQGDLTIFTVGFFSNPLRRRLEHAAAFAFKIPCN